VSVNSEKGAGGGSDEPQSVFQVLPPERWLTSNATSFAISDAFPVSPGHALVVPKRRIPTWWEATDEERIDLIRLVDVVKQRLDEELHPDGYNVGFNSGQAAGQTIEHLHLHVIPRYAGDMADPRGGVRHVIPSMGNYFATDDGASLSVELGADWFVPTLRLLDNRTETVSTLLKDCLGDRRFDRADLVVSFVMRSGVGLIGPALEDALARRMHVRILTTDYLQTTEPDALARLIDLSETFANSDPENGGLEIRVFSDAATSFHPKGYLFWSSVTGTGVSIVGSSNLSRSGMESGIEWNLSSGPALSLVASFEGLWNDPRSAEITHEWLRAYRLRRPPDLNRRLAEPEIVEELPEPVEIPTPRPIQHEALIALKESTSRGHRAGLVVMATGLGKTWLAAFLAREFQARSLLFVAHREEILRQSRDVFRAVLPDCDAGLLVGDERALDAKYLFASVQSLSHFLTRWPADRFDVIVVDEFHHAAAPTYRRIIESFIPQFLLGLTATPDRLDGADLLGLCGDNLVYECGLAEGIARGELCGFEYWAEKDVADFAPIPWRNGRFDPVALAAAIETQERAEQELAAWRLRGGTRTLAFCCSVTHADFMADFFAERGVRAVAVHSGPTSANRRRAIEDLEAGALDVVFAVDLFNEGVDLPALDTVLMLRPTDSPVVFLQQLGRGLRTAVGKAGLTVIDFIGNHRSFLFKPRTLLALGTSAYASARAVVEAMQTGEFGLPPECSVHFDLEVVDLLARLTQHEQGNSLARYCREYELEHGRRATALQAWRAGLNPGATGREGWFGALDMMELLGIEEQAVVRATGPAIRDVEKANITKSYKLVCLQAFLELNGLRSGVTLGELALRSREILRGDPRLAADVGSNLSDDDERWKRYWRQWPVAAWTGELAGSSEKALFRVDGDRLFPAFAVPSEMEAGLTDLLFELVDYRLCRYFDNKQVESGEWRLRVGQANGRPLVWLNREQNPGLPEGDVEVLVDGHLYIAGFVKIALNVMRDSDAPGVNELPGLMRRWFGDGAGSPGTAQIVELRDTPMGLVMAPSRR
jgi:superfamily II DNA or RNA helicase/diadenosine tetraphosphate (Ap4A) HIT family hydrolase/HKD family nuclease